jgi:hypothetical protein
LSPRGALLIGLVTGLAGVLPIVAVAVGLAGIATAVAPERLPLVRPCGSGSPYEGRVFDRDGRGRDE